MTTRSSRLLLIAFGCALVPSMAGGQGLTGTLIGTVRDEQGGVLPGAGTPLHVRGRDQSMR